MLQTSFVKFQQNMQNEVLTPFREHLKKHRMGLALKRAFDILAAVLCIVILSPFFLIFAVFIKTTNGPIFYRQLRVGRDGRKLFVLKLRTMVVNADKDGEITVGSDDARITGVGKILRATNFDEFPQFFQVFAGSMSIVGVRPEVPHYVECYTHKDYATLLMKPGLTSPVAIVYRHESELLSGCTDPEKKYIEEILPAKMVINRAYIAEFSFANDFRIIGRTIKCLFEKDQLLEKSK